MSTGTVDRGARQATTVEAPVARVLVVDDEASMRDMLRIVLRRDGYEVLVADGARAATAMAAWIGNRTRTLVPLPTVDDTWMTPL